MTTFRIAGTRLAMACVLYSCAAAPATAQPSAPPLAQSPLTVERIENRFLIAPDFKVTEVDDSVSKLAGVYGGWLMDRNLLVGAGAYWLANRSDSRKMAYGGLMVGWRERADRRIGFGVKGLVGLGRATLASTLVASPQVARDMRRFDEFAVEQDIGAGLNGRPRAAISTRRVAERPVRLTFRDDFFIAEPQASVLVKITSWLRLDGGVGYRVIAGAEGRDERLRGVTGNLAFQFGGGS